LHKNITNSVEKQNIVLFEVEKKTLHNIKYCEFWKKIYLIIISIYN
jgi:hypothetical protein